MSSLVLYMSMSLDGFIAGPGDTKDNPFGTGGQRLHKWLGPGGESVYDFRPADEPSRTIFDEVMSTGAVITGRRTGDFVGYWGGAHRDGVPMFVPTHRAPASTPPGDVRFVTDGIQSCVEQAKAAAGDRDVMLRGAYTARQCLRARVLDVLEIQLVPVLFGQDDGFSRVSGPTTSSSRRPGRSSRPALCTFVTRCGTHEPADPSVHVDVPRRLHRRTGRP